MTSAEFDRADDLMEMGTTKHPNSYKPPSGPSSPCGWQGQIVYADEWVVFDPLKGGEKELEEFLQLYAPSVTERLVSKE